MKKILNLFLMAIAIFTLASCFNNTENTKFEITSYPKTTYVLGDTFSWKGLQLNVNGVTYTYTDEADNNGLPVGVQLPTTMIMDAGTHEARISYSTSNLTATFQYTVIDSYFANGDGTQTAPYQISTFDQLIKALENEKIKDTTNGKTYYVLVNDINCKDQLTGANSRREKITKDIVIDGQGYSLRNVEGALGYMLENSTFKNINFHFDGSNEFEYKKRGAIFEYLHGDVTFENINTFGKIDFNTSNASIFGQIEVQKDNDKNIAVLKNCNNYASFTNLGTYGAVFTGGTYYKENESKVYYDNSDSKNSVWYVLNCKNYGEYIAAHVGLINPNANYLDTFKAYYVVDENTKNYGQLLSIGDKVENIYKVDKPKTEKKLSSLLCAYPGSLTMAQVFDKYYKYEAAQGIKAGTDFIGIANQNIFSKFEPADYDNMAKVDIQDNSKLTYNFYIQPEKVADKLENAKIHFSFEKGEESKSKIAYYVISLTGGSTKHDAEGHPGLKSANSTFATIKVNGNDLAKVNDLGLFIPTAVFNDYTGVNWTDVDYENWNSSDALGYSESGCTLVSGSEYLYYSNGKTAYVVKPCLDNGYATASGLSIITIVAFDNEGNVCGGGGIEIKELKKVTPYVAQSSTEQTIE